MKKYCKKFLVSFLSIFMVLPSFPVSISEVMAESTTYELTVNFDASNYPDDQLGLWFWGEAVPEGEAPTNWMVDDSKFERKEEADFVSTQIPIIDVTEPVDLGYIIVSHDGEQEKIFGDEDGSLTIYNSEIDEIWIDKNNKVHYLEPTTDDNTLRIYLQDEQDNHENITTWLWGDKVHEDYKNGDFATDRLTPTGKLQNFSYFDVGLNPEVTDDSIGFLFHDGEQQTSDYKYELSQYGNTIYTKWNNDGLIYDSMFFDNRLLVSAKWTTDTMIRLKFDGDLSFTNEEIQEEVKLYRADKEISYSIQSKEKNILEIAVAEDELLPGSAWKINYRKQEFSLTSSWEITDELFATDVELGLSWNNGLPVLKFWSPSADQVEVVVYDKDDQNTELFNDKMTLNEDDHVWEWTTEQTGLENHYYQFKITRGDDVVYGLDPYAKSMAPWNGIAIREDSNASSKKPEYVGKAAFVKVQEQGPKNLAYADIKGYQDRQDAIIYEAHVRDFTSDPNIENELTSQFGTFEAFIDKLDYIEEMGVTHIQLLPIMSYYFINESAQSERSMDETAQGAQSNYNWGYDPHSYFSVTGFYSENPKDASLRIKELKNLINEIHKRDMGVILDVVYNHTAQVSVLEDLEPGYYHFMDSKGTPKTSFGGGRLGTTHAMSRKLLVDSIEYWTNEFKVDGFRFDMMGDHDAETIQKAYDVASQHNPKTLFLGEGWRTYEGDEGDPRKPADQDWMSETSDVGVFSDDMRNIMKSGFGSEGQPKFLTGGAQKISSVFNNIKAQPENFVADEPKDVVNYLEAHDNLTLHDVIASSIKKSPQKHQKEILQRQRLGNLLLMTSQGTIFIHSGQEYGRTRQLFADPSEIVGKMEKIHTVKDETGNLIEYPYFIDDAYNSSDAINRFDWEKVKNSDKYPHQVHTMQYTKDLIELRRQLDIFRLDSVAEIDQRLELLEAPEIKDSDLVLSYKAKADDFDYYVLINADDQERTLTFDSKTMAALQTAEVIVDQEVVSADGIENPKGYSLDSSAINLEGLTGVVLKVNPDEVSDPDSGYDYSRYKEKLNDQLIFHAWNWSFEAIEEELDNIKAAGFNAIQTSPVQPPKEQPSSGKEWWLLYQPTDFAIEHPQLPELNTPLGTKDEFESLTTAAEKRDLDIIVDVVFNHLGNDGGGAAVNTPSKNVAERFKLDRYWHDLGSVTNWNDRYEVTQKDIGLPDLNTQDEDIQKWATAFLNELIEIGATGFRFDAAKHIELPNDSATNAQGDFWPNVFENLESDDLYLYGEVLQDKVDEFAKYIEFMDVTASSYGFALKDVVKGNPTYSLLDYRAKGSDPNNLVTWVESHDTYANDAEHTTHLSAQEILLGWSVLAARKDQTALFFNRPQQEIESKFANKIGEPGDEFWKEESISALNKFRSDMSGENEYLRYPSEQSIIIERGQAGAVLTNFSKKAIDLDIATSLPDGTYVDKLNSKQKFTVQDNKLSGSLAPQDVAIVYSESTLLPIIESNIVKSIFEDSLELTLTVKNANTASYRINQGDWTAFNDVAKIEIGKNDPVGSKYRIQIKAENAEGEITRSFNYEKVVEENTRVYFKKPVDWLDKINLYVHDAVTKNSEDPSELLGGWPGQEMEKTEDGWYYWEFEKDFIMGNIIFNDGINQYPASGDPGIIVKGTVWIDDQFNLTDYNPNLDKSDLDVKVEEVKKLEASDYTVESWNKLQIALNLLETTQQEIDAKIIAIEKAIVALKKVNDDSELDKSVLEEKITEATKLAESHYSKETWKNLQEALNLPETTQQEIDTKIIAIEKAIVALKKVNDDSELDKSVLEEKIAEATKLTESHYSKETWKNLQEALNLPETTQEEVDYKHKEITDAINSLKKKETISDQPGNKTDNKKETSDKSLPRTGEAANTLAPISLVLIGSGLLIVFFTEKKKQ